MLNHLSDAEHARLAEGPVQHGHAAIAGDPARNGAGAHPCRCVFSDGNPAPTSAYFFGDALSRPPPDGLPVVEGQPAEPLPPFEPPPFELPPCEPPPFEPFAILVSSVVLRSLNAFRIDIES